MPAGAAHAATASVGPSATFPGQQTLQYVADPGEANNVTIATAANFQMEIHDAGATITPGVGCTSVDPNTVRCAVEEDENPAKFQLGDGDDFLSMKRWQLPHGSYAGGDGDDTIIAANITDSLEYVLGGPGDDTLRGRDGQDVLNGGPGADAMYGGSSFASATAEVEEQEIDIVTYAGRMNDVFVDQDGVADDGELGEGDMVAGDIETIVGGRGNDRLTGKAVHESFFEQVAYPFGTDLYGGQGSDILRGGPAGQLLWGAQGDDVLRGAGGRDFLEGRKGDDTVVGGPGPDRLHGNDGSDTLRARDGRRDHLFGGDGRDRAQIDIALDTYRGVERLLP